MQLASALSSEVSHHIGSIFGCFYYILCFIEISAANKRSISQQISERSLDISGKLWYDIKVYLCPLKQRRQNTIFL